MGIGKLTLGVAFAVLAVASTAIAAEPRPWLCRDKPVFSSQQPMSFELVAKPQWHMFLMEFTPGGGHDGFDIAKEVPSSSKGSLPAGRYFAVALHNSGGRWICPANVHEQPAGDGIISNLCFADGGGGCPVTFAVRPESAPATAPGVP